MPMRYTKSSYTVDSQIKVADQENQIEDLNRQLMESLVIANNTRVSQSSAEIIIPPAFNLSQPPPSMLLNIPSRKRHSFSTT
jgi:hypothetical protein